jgi:hypothetical protein
MKTELKNIKNYLLTKYTSFDRGYANVSKPNRTDLIIDEDENEFKGLSDTEGNYFYIRSLKTSTFEPIHRGARIAFYKKTTQCRIVAMHTNANEEDIETILISSITSQGHNVSKTDLEKTRVFRDETGTDLTKKDYTLVSCDFEIVETVNTKNCSLNPCNC